MFAYDAQQQDELKFGVNDKLTILRKGDEAEREWWWARSDVGQEGYVPRNLLGVSSRVFTANLADVQPFLCFSPFTALPPHRSLEPELQ